MFKNISILGNPLSKEELQEVNGGFPFGDGDCCICTYIPAGRPFMILISQSCSIPCPVDGDPEVSGNGC
jgi:bacteriocin-like protein